MPESSAPFLGVASRELPSWVLEYHPAVLAWGDHAAQRSYSLARAAENHPQVTQALCKEAKPLPGWPFHIPSLAASGLKAQLEFFLQVSYHPSVASACHPAAVLPQSFQKGEV